MATNWNEAGITLTDDTAAIIAQFDETAAKVGELDATIAERTTGNTITASFDAVAASAAANFPGVIAWFQRTAAESARFDAVVGVHLRSVTKMLNDLNFLAMVTIGNITQAQQLGGGGGTTITNNNVVVNNTLTGNASTAANGYDIGASLRPGGT